MTTETDFNEQEIKFLTSLYEFFITSQEQLFNILESNKDILGKERVLSLYQDFLRGKVVPVEVSPETPNGQ